MDKTPVLAVPEAIEVIEASSVDIVMIPRAELEMLRLRAANAPEVEKRRESYPSESSLAQSEPARESTRMEEPAASVRRQIGPVGDREREASISRELGERDLRLVELERSCKAAVRDRELATALAGKSLVAGAVVQLIKLWRDEFEAYDEGGQYKVASRDGRALGQVVNEWLSSPEYSHFSLPSSRGGSSVREASRPSSTTTVQSSPKNLGESIVMKWREESVTRPSNLLKPIGLRRHR